MPLYTLLEINYKDFHVLRYSRVDYSTGLGRMGLCNRKEDKNHEIFYRGAPSQFYRGLFGRSQGKCSDPRLLRNSLR